MLDMLLLELESELLELLFLLGHLGLEVLDKGVTLVKDLRLLLLLMMLLLLLMLV